MILLHEARYIKQANLMPFFEAKDKAIESMSWIGRGVYILSSDDKLAVWNMTICQYWVWCSVMPVVALWPNG